MGNPTDPLPKARKPAKKKSAPAREPQPSLFRSMRGIDLKTYKSIRIAVSGDVALNKLETEIINTGDFQRLRRIKQLGTTDLVYPTALHTRFDHSLGTFAIACEMMLAIRENSNNSDEERRIEPEQEQLVRIFALLHDIGHFPFGHTLEDEFCIFPRHDEDFFRINRFLGPESATGGLLITHLGFDLYQRFMMLVNATPETLEGLGEDLFIYDLVNNTVCADLLDYLRRDCYFCNITLDLDYRFLRYLFLHREGRTRRAVVRLWQQGHPTPRRDVISELIRLLDNRYLLGERVYFHHAKLISGAMVAGAVQRSVMEGEIWRDTLSELGDDTLLERLVKSGDPVVRKLASAVRNRQLWKMVYQHPRSAIEAEQRRTGRTDIMREIMRTWWKDPGFRTRKEDELAVQLGLEPGDLLVHCPSSKMMMKVAETQVHWNGSLKAFKDCTDDPLVGIKLSSILKSHENLWAIRVFVNPAAAPEYVARTKSLEPVFSEIFKFD